MHQQQAALENIVGKGEIARNEQFLLFPQCFLLNQIIASPFVHTFHIISLFAAEFEEPEFGIPGKELMSLDANQLYASLYQATRLGVLSSSMVKCQLLGL